MRFRSRVLAEVGWGNEASLTVAAQLQIDRSIEWASDAVHSRILNPIDPNINAQELSCHSWGTAEISQWARALKNAIKSLALPPFRSFPTSFFYFLYPVPKCIYSCIYIYVCVCLKEEICSKRLWFLTYPSLGQTSVLYPFVWHSGCGTRLSKVA